MTDNVIRLPFGQRAKEARVALSEEDMNSAGSPASVSDLNTFRLGGLKYLLGRLTLTLLNYDQGVLCLSFAIDPADRDWLEEHEIKLREALGRIRFVTDEDGECNWTVRPEMPVWLDFPASHPDRLRAYLATDQEAEGAVNQKTVMLKRSVMVTFLSEDK